MKKAKFNDIIFINRNGDNKGMERDASRKVLRPAGAVPLIPRREESGSKAVNLVRKNILC